jgi:hypothetical protein
MTSGMTFYPGGNFHPAAGARDDTGRLWYHGYRFCLWGCGAHDASNGINIDGNRSYVYSDKSPVTYGMAIRCVMR